MYEIKVYIQDATGTDSEECKVYYAIRDTTFEYFISSRMFSACPRFRHDLTPGFDNPPNYVSRDLIDPDHTDTYFDKTEWQDPSDSSKVRYDFESESSKINNRWYWGPETAGDFAAYDDEFDRITPTKELIELYSKTVSFQMISDDVFYKSKLTNKDYTNHDRDYSYFLSWGKSVDDLTEPVKKN